MKLSGWRAASRRSSRDDYGFTLVEMCVVVGILGVLIAMALPAFAAAHHRAGDRAVQVDLRAALVAEKAFYTTNLRFADTSAAGMVREEPGMEYADGLAPAVTRRVYIRIAGAAVFISGKSRTSGTCFYVMEDPAAGTAYARDATCGAADSQTYATAGW